MFTNLDLITLVFSVITGLSGTMMNSFVLTLYLLQWKQSSNSVVFDQIQMSITLTNVILQTCLSVSGILNPLVNFFSFGKDIIFLLFTLQLTLFSVSFWNTAWLSIFFYIRLVNFSHSYLLRMKFMFLSSVPQLIVGSALGSAMMSFPTYWLTELTCKQNRTLSTATSACNVSSDVAFEIFTSFFGYFLPSTLTCLCIGQCVTSLLRHVWRIKFSECHLTSSQLQGHIRASRVMMMRVVLDMTMYLSSTLALLSSVHIHYIFIFLVWTFILMYPTAQCLILIHGNPKLKSKICGHCASK